MLEPRLQKRTLMGNLRQLPLEKKGIDFASNDYLGLARSKELAFKVYQEWQNQVEPLNGCGSTGSRLLTGNSSYVQKLEESIAAFHGYDSGLIFNCGYMANVGLISAIAGADDTLFYDVEVHASLRDGIGLCRGRAFPFRHNDLNHLEERLKKCNSKGQRFICIESIYSTNGSMAPLKEICSLAKQYNAALIVDEAHATGACGLMGRGLVAKHKLTSEVFAQVVTFGKALGAHGAIVLGSATLKQMLLNFATSFIYTTALPFHSLAAIKCSYDLFPKMEVERQRLQKLIQLFSTSSQSHIQSFPIKGNLAVKEVGKRLALEGFDLNVLMSPTVRRGHEALRICLHAFNTENEVARCIKLLSQA